MNLQCAQCHDHPLVDHYKQAHYYGIFAFLSRSYLFTDKAKNLTVLAEKAEGEVTYQSVFDPKKETKKTLPVVPGGMAIKEPALEKGKEYEVAPANGVRPVPKFSRRAQLAGQVATAGQRAVPPQHRQPPVGADDGPRPGASARPGSPRQSAVAPGVARRCWPTRWRPRSSTCATSSARSP